MQLHKQGGKQYFKKWMTLEIAVTYFGIYGTWYSDPASWSILFIVTLNIENTNLPKIQSFKV